MPIQHRLLGKHYTRAVAFYKRYRARKERAKLREALNEIRRMHPTDKLDWDDYCGHDDCHICGVQYAPEGGPNYELEPFDSWEIF